MQKRILVSIIIPAYSCFEDLMPIINCVLEQTLKDIEIIIVYSKENNDAINTFVGVVMDNRIKLIEGPEGLNSYIKALHVGFSISVGKYIVPIDEKTIMYSNRLPVQCEFLESHSDIGVCGSYVLSSHGDAIVHKYPVDHTSISVSMLYSNPMYFQSAIIRRSVIKAILKRKSLPVDYKLWIDLAMKGCLFHTLPIVLSECRIGEPLSPEESQYYSYNEIALAQIRYADFIANEIVNRDSDYLCLFENMIQLCNTDKLSVDEVKSMIGPVYTRLLRREKEMNASKQKKLLFCIDSLSTGGAEKLLIDILTHFDYSWFSIDLLVLGGTGFYFKDVPQPVRVFTLDGAEANLLESYDFEIAFLEGLAVKYIAQRKSSATKMAWIHTDLLTFHWSGRFYSNPDEERACYAAMTKVVFVSRNAMTQFELLFPGAATSTKVIYCLMDKLKIEQRSLLFEVKKSPLLTLCSVGRLTPEKGYDRLLPIINRLVKEGFRFNFLIIGDGEQYESLKSSIERYSLHDVVQLIGFVANPYPYIKESDVFVSSSLVEGYPLVIAEALCLGRPVIATGAAGAKEMLDNGKYGLLMDIDEESIYQGLKRILTDADLRDELGKKAILRSCMFNVEKTMEQIYELFLI